MKLRPADKLYHTLAVVSPRSEVDSRGHARRDHAFGNVHLNDDVIVGGDILNVQRAGAYRIGTTEIPIQPLIRICRRDLQRVSAFLRGISVALGNRTSVGRPIEQLRYVRRGEPIEIEHLRDLIGALPYRKHRSLDEISQRMGDRIFARDPRIEGSVRRERNHVSVCVRHFHVRGKFLTERVRDFRSDDF